MEKAPEITACEAMIVAKADNYQEVAQKLPEVRFDLTETELGDAGLPCERDRPATLPVGRVERQRQRHPVAGGRAVQRLTDPQPPTGPDQGLPRAVATRLEQQDLDRDRLNGGACAGQTPRKVSSHSDLLTRTRADQKNSDLSHVHEARVVALECNGDCAGWSVAMLGDDEVGFTCSR